LKRTLTLVFLLALFHYNLVFAATPAAKEFIDGNYIQFSTSGHPKSKGINMTISYPRSWLAKEGERPNIVQKFHSDGGQGSEIVLIITKSLPLPPGTVVPESELQEFFAPNELKKMVPQGAVFVDAESTKIESLPAGILEYSMRQERAGATIYSQVISYIFIYGTTMVQLQCAVSTDPMTVPNLAPRMESFKPLFFMMANSIVLPDKWK